MSDPRRCTPGPRLRLAPLWQGIGALLIAAIVYASLSQAPPGPSWPGADKLGHFCAYAILAAWYLQIYHSTRGRVAVVLACVVLGGSLEVLQPLLAQRWFEWLDLLANTAGAGLALVVCRGPGAGLLGRIERVLTGAA